MTGINRPSCLFAKRKSKVAHGHFFPPPHPRHRRRREFTTVTVENWKVSQKGQTEDAELKRLQELAKYAIVGGVPVAVQEALTPTLHIRKQNQTNKQQ